MWEAGGITKIDTFGHIVVWLLFSLVMSLWLGCLSNIFTVIATITCLVGWLDCTVEGILQDSTDVQAVAVQVCCGLLVILTFQVNDKSFFCVWHYYLHISFFVDWLYRHFKSWKTTLFNIYLIKYHHKLFILTQCI